jgi:elongation factor Ts
MVEVNCETDFVAREQRFRAFAQEVADVALAERPASLEALLALPLESGESVDERRRTLVAKIGENIGLRRFAVLEARGAPGRLCAWHAHRRSGCAGGRRSGARSRSCHACRSEQSAVSLARRTSPRRSSRKEREVLTEQARDENKPPEIVAKMVEGGCARR